MLKSIFSKASHKIMRIIFHKMEFLYYGFFYSKSKINPNFVKVRYLFCGNDDLKDIAKNYRDLFPDKMEGIIAKADLICEHVFDLLGSGSKALSSKGKGYQAIPWHSDFISGYRWNPKTFYRDIRYGHIKGVDVIVPWELSRFQHLHILGQAYSLSENKKYASEFKNQINDWIDSNKVGFGVNWVCTMDVALRALNWLTVKELFEASFSFSEVFLKKFYGNLYEHGKYIRTHLQHSKNTTPNHRVCEIVGLLAIALYCPFFEKSSEWRDFSIKELEKEIRKQVYPDGCDYEASTTYHLLVLEVFFYALLLSERAGIVLSDLYKTKVKQMCECLLYCTKPNARIVQIGDNDNGRAIKLAERPTLESKYLLTLAAIYFKERNFKLKQFNLEEESFWIFGKEAKDIWKSLSYREPLEGAKSFCDTGWYIMQHNSNYCFISCGCNGQEGKGGHAHNDKLSFELMLNNQDIIVDPGTYAYTSYPEKRNKFRSTGYHNTLKFGNYEQNEISKKDIFSLPDKVRVKKAILKKIKNEISFEGEIQYLDFTHKRIITSSGNLCNWRIIDKISSPKLVTAKTAFHLSSEVFYDRGFIFSRKTSKKVASIETKGYRLEKHEYDYSPRYGVKLRAECLVANIPAIKDIQPIITYIRTM